MGLFGKERTSGTEWQRLRAAANCGTLAGLLAAGYRKSDARHAELGPELLFDALGNGDPSACAEVSNRLLDDGASPRAVQGGTTLLHSYLARTNHDYAAEAPLLKRLIGGGADVNAVSKKSGTPLEALAGNFKHTDTTLAPFYDIFFAQDDLDLLQVSMYGRIVLENLRLWLPDRAELVARAERYLTDAGL